MKLKQRVIVTGSLFLTMVSLFTIGMQLNWPAEKDKESPPSTPDSKAPTTIKPIAVQIHTPSKSYRPPFLPPSLPINLTDLRIVPWPRGPRRMLDERLEGLLRSHRRGGLELSVPPEIAELNPWGIWRGWVEENTLYPQEAFYSDEMNHILATMATANITSFGVGVKGTQLKATAMLGNQRTVFKPKRYRLSLLT